MGGEVIGGILVHHYGAPRTFVLFGILCIVILVLYIVIRMVWGKSEAQMQRDNDLHSRGEQEAEPKTAEEAKASSEDDIEKKELDTSLSNDEEKPIIQGMEKTAIDEVDNKNNEPNSIQTKASSDIDKENDKDEKSNRITLNEGKPIMLTAD